MNLKPIPATMELLVSQEAELTDSDEPSWATGLAINSSLLYVSICNIKGRLCTSERLEAREELADQTNLRRKEAIKNPARDQSRHQ